MIIVASSSHHTPKAPWAEPWSAHTSVLLVGTGALLGAQRRPLLLLLLLLLCELALVEAGIHHSTDTQHHLVVLIIPGTDTTHTGRGEPCLTAWDR